MEKVGSNQQSSEEKILRRYFIVSASILIIFIVIGVVEVEVVIERAIRILSFWFLLFVCIFVPRRMLKRSKNFRYMVLYIRKNYPMMFYYRNEIQIIKYINFFYKYTAFYLERILKYFLVGTKIKWLSPYRKNWEKGEFWMMIILELYRWVNYLVLYVLKIFYEIVKFFDNATIYKIIRSRILGFMMVTIGYIIIGVKFFICYILSMVIIAFIYYTLSIYLTYKEWMKKYPLSGRNSNLSWVLDMRGFVNRLEFFSKIELIELRVKTILIFDAVNVIKHKFLFNWYKSIIRKYGLKKVTKCWIDIYGLTEVEEKTLIAVKFLNLKEWEKEKLKILEISSNKFTTRFWKKRKWYNSTSMMNPFNAKDEDNFDNSFMRYKNFCNLLEFKLYFMLILSCGLVEEDVWNEKDEMIFDFWKESKLIQGYYLGVLKNYFEFKDVYKFVKEVDIKIYEKEKDFIKFYDNYVINKGIFIFIKNAHIYHLEKVITDEEYKFLKNIGSLVFMYNLELDINKKEWKEIMEKHNYIEVIKGLKEKGYLTEEIIKYLESLDN
jgi:hypothetical protein